MIRIEAIQTALLHLVGWEQANDPRYYIARNLLSSESGLTYQGAHPMVSIENAAAVMPEDYSAHYKEWNKFVHYKKGAKCRHNNVIWEAKEDNVNQEPPASDFNDDFSVDFGGEYWQAFNPVSDFVEALMRRNIAQVVQTFLTKKSLLRESKTLLERMVFFDGAGRINNTIPSNGNLVGFELTPVRSLGVTAKIERIGLQMTGATGKVKLYLFSSDERDPIKEKEVTISKGNGSMEWFDLPDWYMRGSGSYYLCYNQNDLPAGMEAINVARDWSREPCGTCNRGSLEAWRELTRFLQVSPYRTKALETFGEYPELWDIEENVYTNTHNYGLNVEVSVGCDLTDFIIKQRDIFATVLQKQLAVNLIRTLALNPDVRVNRRQSNATKEELLYEIDGNPQGRATGLGKELNEAYDALDLDTRGIDRVCLICKPSRVRYTHV